MKFSKLYYNEAFTPGEVVSLVNDKKEYVVVDEVGVEEYKIADIKNKSKTKIVNAKDIIAVYQDLLGGTTSTEPPKEKIKRVQTKDVKFHQFDLFGENILNITKESQIDNKKSIKIKQAIDKIKQSINPNDLKDSLEKIKAGIDNATKGLDPKIMDDLSVAYNMIQDTVAKNYTELPTNTLMMLTAVLLYVISPVDVIPDTIPVVGWLDDAWVISRLFPALRKDVDKYRAWKKENPDQDLDQELADWKAKQ